MKNKITATIEFYFKGKKIASSLVIDLDKIMKTNNALQDFDFPNLYSLLAQQINLSPYSYEYEMMLSEAIKFNTPQGTSKLYLDNGVFDFHSFSKAWKEINLLNSLEEISCKYMSIENLTENENLKNALAAAYRLGTERSELS